jgi:hypothetical protein
VVGRGWDPRPSEETNMNKTEREMVDILCRGRDEFGYVGVKAEFEAEGTRVDELLRLVEIAHHADLKLAVKIGGCEAVRDLLEAKQIGVNFIIAPMIETSYALSKYVLAKNNVYSDDEALDTDFLFNMETVTGYDNREAITALAAEPNGVQGVVFGRVDFTGSLGANRDAINGDDITERILEVSRLCEQHQLSLVVGGGVSADSVLALKRIRGEYLTRFETRKVVFGAEALDAPNIEQGLLNAVHFELLWLMNKRDYYGAIHREDANRIEMLDSRWQVLKNTRS